jgi:hypothetical protein
MLTTHLGNRTTYEARASTRPLTISLNTDHEIINSVSPPMRCVQHIKMNTNTRCQRASPLCLDFPALLQIPFRVVSSLNIFISLADDGQVRYHQEARSRCYARFSRAIKRRKVSGNGIRAYSTCKTWMVEQGQQKCSGTSHQRSCDAVQWQERLQRTLVSQTCEAGKPNSIRQRCDSGIG